MSQIVVDTDVASYIFNWHSLAELYADALRGSDLVLSFMSVAELRMGQFRQVGVVTVAFSSSDSCTVSNVLRGRRPMRGVGEDSRISSPRSRKKQVRGKAGDGDDFGGSRFGVDAGEDAIGDLRRRFWRLNPRGDDRGADYTAEPRRQPELRAESGTGRLIGRRKRLARVPGRASLSVGPFSNPFSDAGNFTPAVQASVRFPFTGRVHPDDLNPEYFRLSMLPQIL